MFHPSGKTMKWATLLKDFKQKVGLSQTPAASPTNAPFSGDPRLSPQTDGHAASTTREKQDLESDFRKHWRDFLFSSSDKERDYALNTAVDIFVRLVKQRINVLQLLNTLDDPLKFPFVIGRTFVDDVGRLKNSSKDKPLHVSLILDYFTNASKEGTCLGLNLLHAVQALVSETSLDKQYLLNSGILCCLIHILNALLGPDDINENPVLEASVSQEISLDATVAKKNRLEERSTDMLLELVCDRMLMVFPSSTSDLSYNLRVDMLPISFVLDMIWVEGIVVHVMKALANQPSAAQSLTEDDSLERLFHMVANGSLTVFSHLGVRLIALHTSQLHRHAMQILHLLLVNDNGSSAKYIHKHHLIKVFLMAVKDFNPETGDSAYTMGIVDLLLECVELSYRSEAGGIKLREDIHNAHGYQFLVQFALVLSALQKNQVYTSDHILPSDQPHDSDSQPASSIQRQASSDRDLSPSHISPSLSRLLDVLVNLAQTGPTENSSLCGKAPKPLNSKVTGHHSRPSAERIEEVRERGSTRVKDLEAVQMLQDIFLKADSVDLQAEILNRMLKIFSSHIENYKICQQLRIVPLFILNMAGFPMSLHEKILKILEYAVTVVNCVPEQELLSLCCLLQQPITTELKHSVLSFFIKLLSFDQQYKKVLREVGVLEVLLDDIRHHKYLSSKETFSFHQNMSGSNSFTNHKDRKDAFISSPIITGPGSAHFRVFEDESTVNVAWDCLIALLKKAEANQSSFRSSNGVTLVFPFLSSDTHRNGVLRLLSTLLIEDLKQAHPEELGALIEILNNGMITSLSGSQYKLHDDAKCDTLGALWRILQVNPSAQRVFGESSGFSLILTMLHSLNSGARNDVHQSSLMVHVKIFCFLLRVVTAGVFNNPLNRINLHLVISSQAFYDLLNESGMLCVDYEKEVVQLLLELALEIVIQPSCVNVLHSEGVPSEFLEAGTTGYLISSSSEALRPEKERVYNPGAVFVLIRLLLHFTPKIQFELLTFIEKLAHGGPFNQENLTSAGCVGLLLETIQPFLSGSSPFLLHALGVVQALGSYRLSSAELRTLVRYILQSKLIKSSHSLVGMMKRVINMEEVTSENVALAPFVEMDMSKMGHASIQISLGERTWPPAAGYSFVCWFWFTRFMSCSSGEKDRKCKAGSTKQIAASGGQNTGKHALRIFSVGNVDDINSSYAELFLQDDGVFTLSTSNSCSLSFPSTELEQDRWHHLVVVHGKPNALAGLFQASVACLYLNGKLRHTGKLGYSPSPVGKQLQVTIGTPMSYAKTSELSWRLRCCYLYEEVLSSGGICFMYLLGRKYQGLFQDADLLQFVPNEAYGGGNMAILDSLDAESPVASTQKVDSINKERSFKDDSSGMVWDWERIYNLSLQLSGKKLIFAFDGTSESFRTSGVLSMLNLVDPLSAAASPMGGIPRFGRLHGDIFICRPCAIGDSVRTVGGMTVVLALVEAANTRDMLHMALTLLASALYQNPQNVRDMQTYRGYHLLSLFLHRRMSLFDMQSLNIFFQIAACEASFSEKHKFLETPSVSSNDMTASRVIYDDASIPKFPDEFSSAGFHGDLEDFVEQKDLLMNISELENADPQQEHSNCIVLSNADMVEHVLLDWTLWVTAPIPIQIALLGFLEHMVSMHRYRNHNLTMLRQINLVQHLLVTLQRGDVEVPVLEKLVVLLGVILEDGFLSSELELVVKFVIMTFDPPELTIRHQVARENMGKHVIVRNMLLEMLIDLQVTIKSEDFLEQWHKIVSSKLITYFLDEAVHPTSMRWVMTLLGVCLSSSPTFVLKFRNSGGFQGLARVLPSFYDSPEIYYTLFCLIFAKPVYPRLPEVRMLDFHALIPNDLSHCELKFIDLLDSVIAMAKAAFDKLSLQSMLAYQAGIHSQVSASLVVDPIEGGELQGEALLHKTYAARLMGGEAAAPTGATSVLRYMVDLAKMCRPFSAICRRADFLEGCVDLYFSCVRAASALKMMNNLTLRTMEDKNLNDSDDTHSSQNTFSSLPNEQEQSAKTSISIGSFPHVQISTSSEDLVGVQNAFSEDYGDKRTSPTHANSAKPFEGLSEHDHSVLPSTTTLSSQELSGQQNDETASPREDSFSSASLFVPESPALSKKSNFKVGSVTPTSSPIGALSSWLSGNSDSKPLFTGTPSMVSSVSGSEMESSQDVKSNCQGSLPVNLLFTVNPQLLLEMDDAGSGGGPCSSSASAVLDFIAEVFADIMAEHIKAGQVIETILETIPLYVDAETALVFQGLCLSRLMNFLERRLLRDDEEAEKKLDKSRWSINLDALCWMVVDRVYMGAFPQPNGILKILEFFLSMLQFSNKDGRIEDATPPGRGLLSIARGNRQLEAYIHSLLKNTNRMIMYCFLPSFLSTIEEHDFLSRIGFQIEAKKNNLTDPIGEEDSGIDICTVLQLLLAHQRIIICPTNLDNDLISCLTLNLIYLLKDKRRPTQNTAVDILKYLLLHRRAALEELLVSKPSQGQQFDVLHGGFDRLLTGSSLDFYEWLNRSEQTVSKVLEQCAAIMWVQYISSAAKFPALRIKGMEVRRKREMVRRSKEVSKLDLKHYEQMSERRYALEMVREAMSTELRVLRQDKYGWVLHAESEWQAQLQQLVHERGIFPVPSSSFTKDPDWKLCPIEGPYRMRKKLERCKLRIETIDNILNNFGDFRDEITKENGDGYPIDSEANPELFLHVLPGDDKENCFDTVEYDNSFFKEADEFNDGDSSSAQIGWNDDHGSSKNEQSLHSALELGAKSISFSVNNSESFNVRSDLGSPRLSSSMRVDESKSVEDKPDKEVDNGEYLIRPYLEPQEKIRSRYNCERVVGLDKHDGIFLIGDLCLYVIENFYIDDAGCVCEKECEDELSVIDQALGVKKDVTGSSDVLSKSPASWEMAVKALVGGRAWAYSGGAWGKEKACNSGNLPHLWRMWKLDSVHEILKRDYQLRPVAIEIFSMDGCNDLLVFHKKEREEVFKNLVAMNLPRNSMLDTTISGSLKQDSNERGRLFKIMAKSFSKRWQNGEISNFQYLMHLNTLAGRGYNDLTQYPVFPWVLADYESETLDLSDPMSFRKLDKPMGCQTAEGEDEFRKRYESWDDPDVPKFHYGSHYSSAGIVLFYLLRLPPFSTENLKLQGGQFDHADRLFNSIRDTWSSASGKGNTSDVKELIPEFFYMPEFLENRFNLDLGEKQSGEKVGDVFLPPWAKGSPREFIRKHREALESDYVSENLHHWIDLIFGHKQRGKAAEEAINVFYHYTYEGSVDIDAVSDPAMKASILAQINHFGQTPRQLFLKPHVKRRSDWRPPIHMLRYCNDLVPHEVRKTASPITQIVTFYDKIMVAGANTLIKPVTYSMYIAWGYPDRSLRFVSYDQDKLLATHENLHGGNQLQCAGVSHDGNILVTGGDDGVVSVWRISKEGNRVLQRLELKRSLCAHTAKVTCLAVSQPYTLIVSGSEDCTVMLWDLSNLVFVKQMPQFPAPVSAVYINDLTGEIITAAGVLLAVWSINGECLAVVNTSQLPSDSILSVTGSTLSDWLETNWYVTGHQSGAIKVWRMVHFSEEPRASSEANSKIKSPSSSSAIGGGLGMSTKCLEYRLILYKVLKTHKHPVTALHLTSDLKQLLSGDSGGSLLSWTLPDNSLRRPPSQSTTTNERNMPS